MRGRGLVFDRRILRIKDLNKWLKVRLFSLLLEPGNASCYVGYDGDVRAALRDRLDQECVDQIATSTLTDLIRVMLPRFSDEQILGVLKKEDTSEFIYDLPQDRIERIYQTIMAGEYPIFDSTLSSISHAIGLDRFVHAYWDKLAVKEYLLRHGDTENDIKDVLAMELISAGVSDRHVFDHLRTMSVEGKIEIRRKV